MDNLPPGWGHAAAWLASVSALALVMTTVLEKTPWWDKLGKELKAVISFLVAVALGLLAATMTTWIPSGVRPDAETWFRAVWNAGAVWLGSQWSHYVFHIAPKAKAEEKVITVTANAPPASLPADLPPAVAASEALPGEVG